jgi:hypothetical protein
VREQQIVSTGYGRFRITREYDPSVRVPDFVLKCVGFVGEVDHRTSSGVEGELHATGFFLSVPCQRLRASHVYFVTAKHVAERLREREIYFLVNRMHGGTISIEATNKWWFHPTDPTADIALVQLDVNPLADIMSVEVQQLATPQILAQMDIGIGDEVFATGLFSHVPAVTRNIPIVRHGNIAMMPGEQIQTDLGFADVYLVEARSMGGLSGSPVFVRPTVYAKLTSGLNRQVDFLGVGHGVTLLGLMHGHWDIRESELNKPSFSQDRKHGVNLGIAIVVPAVKILETLNQQELVTLRKQQEETEEKSHVPGTDGQSSS